eukprot:9959180-Alexandrium_andersonii.AAC.1
MEGAWHLTAGALATSRPLHLLLRPECLQPCTRQCCPLPRHAPGAAGLGGGHTRWRRHATNPT